MISESVIQAKSIDASGAFKDCAELCLDCPRRTGERTARVKGIKGWLGKKVTRSVHGDPLKSGKLASLQTNGRHGLFYDQDTANSGTVTNLNADTASRFVEAVIACEGPEDKGNTCSALGPKSFWAICDLDESMEHMIDRLPIEEIMGSIMSDSTRISAPIIPETQVFVNNSRATDLSDLSVDPTAK